MKTQNNDPFKLLVIEDDPELIQLIESYYKPRGFDVDGFSDPLLAQESLMTGKKTYDVALVDLNLPHMTGIEFIKKFKVDYPHIPILLMTADTNIENAVEAIESGAYDYVVKPLHFQQLSLTLKRAVILKRIQDENKVLKETVDGRVSFDNYLFKSQKMQTVLDLAKRIANSTSTVLIYGESGTGKEVVARTIHKVGKYKDKPFIAINCSAIPENLLESELFGHAKGSFTGAFEKKIGLFEEAGDGILFLDEIGDLSLSLQAKLLRVLQDKKIKRVGENKYIDIDSRILAATHKNLKNEVKAGRFREDLYFRLNVIPVQIPPLRERKEDIIPLSQLFLRKFSTENGKELTFNKNALDYLCNLPWQGNVRELENMIERTAVLSPGPEIDVKDLPQLEDYERPDDDYRTLFLPLMARKKIPPLEEISNAYIAFIASQADKTKEQAASDLGIDRKTLYRKLLNLKTSSNADNFQNNKEELNGHRLQ